MPTSPVLVSVIILCRNEISHIAACIDAALAQNSGHIQTEVIVVDGMSTDRTYELVAERYGNNVSLLKNEQLYAPHGMNAGIRHSSGKYLVICGARSIMSEHYIANCIGVLERSPEIRCAGGLIDHVGEDPVSKSIAAAMSSTAGVGLFNFRTISGSGFVDTVSVPVFSRETINTIGLFDENCIRNQDDDFSYRIRKVGFRIWMSAEIHSTYFVRKSMAHLFRQYFQYGFWKVYVNKKHRSITSIRQLFPPALLAVFTLSIFIRVQCPLIVAAVYFLFIAGTSLIGSIRRKCSWHRLAWATINLHVSYGLGYLYGILQLIILNGKIPSSLKASSR